MCAPESAQDFLLMFHNNLSCTISEIDCDFIRKSQNILTPAFCASLKGYTFELGTGAGVQKLE